MYILIERVSQSDKQTLSDFYVLNDDNHVLDHFRGLELPYKRNRRRVSSIPVGEYEAVKHVSPRFGECLWLQDVPNRSEILVHRGNYHSDILGCILIGEDYSDINKDGYLDVIRSRKAMNRLMSRLSKVSKIKIKIVER